jgi:hypothetical protein
MKKDEHVENQGTRDKGQETRDKRQETRDEGRGTSGSASTPLSNQAGAGM